MNWLELASRQGIDGGDFFAAANPSSIPRNGTAHLRHTRDLHSISYVSLALQTLPNEIFQSFWAVVVAQMAAWLRPIQQVHGSYPAIGKISNKTRKDEKMAGNGRFKKLLIATALTIKQSLEVVSTQVHPKVKNSVTRENRKMSIKVAQEWFY